MLVCLALINLPHSVNYVIYNSKPDNCKISMLKLKSQKMLFLALIDLTLKIDWTLSIFGFISLSLGLVVSRKVDFETCGKSDKRVKVPTWVERNVQSSFSESHMWVSYVSSESCECIQHGCTSSQLNTGYPEYFLP